jgi:hypothetical protein
MNLNEEDMAQLNLSILDNQTLDILCEPNSNPFILVSKVLIILKKHSLTPSANLKYFIESQLARGYSSLSFTKYQKVSFGDTIYEFDDCIKRVK